jgi:hypothetical protein
LYFRQAWRTGRFKSGWNEAIEQLTKPLRGEYETTRTISPIANETINANAMQADDGESGAL